MVKRRVRILIRPGRVCDRSELHDDLWLYGREQSAHRMVITRILNVKRNLRVAEEIEPIVEHPRVEWTLRSCPIRCNSEEVIHLQAVNDRHLCTLCPQCEREMVTNESRPANEDDPPSREWDGGLLRCGGAEGDRDRTRCARIERRAQGCGDVRN